MKIREVTYDPRARAGYVYFSDKPVAKTIQHSGFINLDLDRKGGLVGIELLWIGLARPTKLLTWPAEPDTNFSQEENREA